MSATKKTAKKVVKKKSRSFMSETMKNGVVKLLNTTADLKKGEVAGSFIYRVVKDEKTHKSIGSAMNLDGVNIKDLFRMMDHVLNVAEEHGIPREIAIVKLITQ